MTDKRVPMAFVWFVLAIVVVLFIGVISTRYQPTKNFDHGTEVSAKGSVYADATVLSIEVYEYEKREGMRKVRVKVAVEHEGEAVKEISITEWIPVVLLGRLGVGSSVQLIKDPLEEGRVTFGL